MGFYDPQWWFMYWEEWKSPPKKISFFSLWDMVDMKCEKSEKCGQKNCFVRFRWKCFWVRFRRSWEKKVSTFKLICRWARTCSHESPQSKIIRGLGAKPLVGDDAFHKKYIYWKKKFDKIYFFLKVIFYSPEIVYFIPNNFFIEIGRKKKFWSSFFMIFEKIA